MIFSPRKYFDYEPARAFSLRYSYGLHFSWSVGFVISSGICISKSVCSVNAILCSCKCVRSLSVIFVCLASKDFLG